MENMAWIMSNRSRLYAESLDQAPRLNAHKWKKSSLTIFGFSPPLFFPTYMQIAQA